MEKIFVDTSALFSLVNTAERTHLHAWKLWNGFLTEGNILITNNYVIVETLALIQNRLGIEVARQFYTNITPLLQILWSDALSHSQ